MKKVSLYLMMLGLFFVGIFGFGNNLFGATGDTNTVCTELYSPVCGIKSGISTSFGDENIIYKTFSNRCYLNQNTDGYEYLREGECNEIPRSMTLTAPSELSHGKSFTFKWNTSGYEYCNVDYYNMQGNKKELIFQMPKVELNSDAGTTSAEDTGITAIKIDLTCYYKKAGYEGVYTSDMTSKTIALKTACSSEYQPICGQKEVDGNVKGKTQSKKYSYKTFQNKCNYDKYNEGFNVLYWYGECGVPEKSIKTYANKDPIVRGETFNFSWNSIGYEYCKPYGNSVFTKTGKNWIEMGKLNTYGEVELIAPKEGPLELQLVCSFKNDSGEYKDHSNVINLNIKESTVCTMDYTPVCGQRVNEICPDCACIEGYKCDCGPCIKTYDYKIFSNKCVLGQNKEGYIFYKEGECKVRNIEFNAPDSVNMGNNFTVSWKATNYDYCETVISYPQNYTSSDSSTSDTVSKKSISGELTLKAPNYDNESSMKIGIRCYYYDSATNVTKSDFNSKKITLVKETEICSSVYAPVCGVKYDDTVCPMCICQLGEDCGCPPCIEKDPIYKTFGNSCELEKNKEGYTFNNDGECKQDKPCMSTGEPVCGVKYLEACSNGGTCKKTPVYKTFGDECALKINTAKFVFHRSGKCEDIGENVIVLTSRMKIKLDRSLEKLFNSIDQKFTNSVDKIEYYQKILTKLNSKLNTKPEYINIINYLVEKIKEEMTIIAESDDIDIDDLLKIFD